MGDATRPTTGVDLGGARPTRPFPDSRSRLELHRFDEVCRADGLEIVRTPFRAPQANGVAERFVRTARSEAAPSRTVFCVTGSKTCIGRLGSGRTSCARRERLGGVVHEYVLAA